MFQMFSIVCIVKVSPLGPLGLFLNILGVSMCEELQTEIVMPSVRPCGGNTESSQFV